MTYIISDIHGRFDKYRVLLEKINFGEDDTLYVLGDIIDRYDDGLKIMLDMLRRPNVFMIMGNHEAMMLDTIISFTELSETTIDQMSLWMINGGEPTLLSYLKLEEADRILVLNTLENLPLYKEVKIGGTDFILLHGGLDNFSPERGLDSYSRDEIVWARPDLETEYFSDKYLIVGHTPVYTICGEHRIYSKNMLIDIDCGCAFEEGKLGCLCLENMEETYV